MRIYKLFMAIGLSVVLVACNNDTPKDDTKDKATTESTKLKSDEQNDKNKTSEKKTSKDDKTSEKENSTKSSKQTKIKKSNKTKPVKSKQTKVNVYQLTSNATNKYLSAMPNAFNQREYSMIKPYIQSGSEAEGYILSKLPTGSFDNYRITQKSIDRIDVRGNYAHVIVTRVMSSNATGNQLKRVITVFDFIYDKKAKEMKLYDFNDKVIYDVPSEQPTHAQSPSPQPGQTSQSAPNQQSNTSSAKVKNMKQAVQMASDKYRTKVEAYYPEMDIAIIGAEPINGKDIQEDLGGQYYKVKAIDIQSKELLQTYKVYIKNGTIVAE